MEFLHQIADLLGIFELHYDLLAILAAGFTLAGIFGYLAHRLGLSPIVGYLLAGFLVGPHTPGFAANYDLAHQLAEAGVILLMFGVGLHFDTKDLIAVKDVAVPGALAQIAVSSTLGTGVALLMGVPFHHGLMLGVGLSVASTVVLLRVLTDSGYQNTVHGHVAVGWLVVEDLFTVLVLVLLPTLAPILNQTGGEGGFGLVRAFGLAALRLTLLWILVLVVGGKLVPWVLTKVVRTRSEELFTLFVLIFAFATAVIAATVFQASMALGAFLGGMVVGRTRVSHQAGADVLPLRDAFAVLFFLAVGMLFRPGFVLEQPLLVAMCLGIVLLAKPITALIVVAVLRYSSSTGLIVAVSLAQIGEFSFILGQQAMSLDLMSADFYNVLVVCSIVSIALNPGYFRRVPALRRILTRHPKMKHLLDTRAEHKAAERAAKGVKPVSVRGEKPEGVFTAIVVGYGPAGRSVVNALLDEGIVPVVVDMNVDTVNQLNEEKKCPAIFGDSTRKDILEAAGVKEASYLLITLPEFESTVETAGTAADLNPELRIMVRGRFVSEKRIFEQIGVTAAAYEEEEVAKALSRLLQEDIEFCKSGRADGTCKIDFDKLSEQDFNAAKEITLARYK